MSGMNQCKKQKVVAQNKKIFYAMHIAMKQWCGKFIFLNHNIVVVHFLFLYFTRFTHHLTKEKRDLLRDRGTIIPLLSTVEHIFPNEESLSDCQEEIQKIHQKKVRLGTKHTCLYFQALCLLWSSLSKIDKDWQYSHFFTSQETF